VNIVSISLRNMRIRALSTTLTALSITLGTSLIAVLWLAMDAADKHAKATELGYKAIVGPKQGSAMDIVLNTVLNLTDAPGVVPMSVYHELRNGPIARKVSPRYVIPQARGDSYRGFPIIGTIDEMFSKFRRGKEGPLQFAAGKPFSFAHEDLEKFAVEYARKLKDKRAKQGATGGESPGSNHDHDDHGDHDHDGHDHDGHDHDGHDHIEPSHYAVLGAMAAEHTGLRVGSTFVPTHGSADTVGAHIHAADKMKVVGILETTRTPLDRSIFVPLSGYLSMEGHSAIQEAQVAEAGSLLFSSIIVDTRSLLGGPQLRSIFQTRTDAQVAWPHIELARLKQLIGGGQMLLQVVAWVVLVVGALLVLVALYNTMNERRREIAIMRSLGARRHQILRIILQEATFVSLLGGVCGVLLCHAGVLVFAGPVERITTVPMDWTAFSIWEVVLVLGVALLGGISGILPAVKGSKTPVAENLGPTS
jgi:putative ABC transport system permease protein